MYDMLVTLLVEEFEIPETLVRPDATAAELGVDSLMMAEVAVSMQEELGVRLTNVDLDLDSTLQQVADAFTAVGEAANTSAGTAG